MLGRLRKSVVHSRKIAEIWRLHQDNILTVPNQIQPENVAAVPSSALTQANFFCSLKTTLKETRFGTIEAI